MKFTPEDVVRAYKEKGVRPGRAATNVTVRDGKWVVANERFGCCAMGVMVLGTECTAYSESRPELGDEAVQLGVNWAQFAMGFDDGFANSTQHEDRVLGAACRRAVESELGPVHRYDQDRWRLGPT